MLDERYVADAEQRARRFQGAFTGTSGSLAADVLNLIRERHEMAATIHKLERQTAPREGEIPSDWILRGERELHGEPRQLGDGILADQGEANPAERLLLDALDVIRDRRPKYGGPRDHFRRTVGMINAAFAEVLKRPLTEADWAVIMTLDKVARYMGPTKTADGPIDLAGYAACLAEVEAP